MNMDCRYPRSGVIASAIVGILLTCVANLHAATVSLDDLVSGNGEIVVGDKQFDEFGYLSTGDMPDATGVNVSSFTDSDGNFGLRFQGAFLDFQGGGASDALITYRVTVLDPNFLISDAHLAGNPAVIGGSGFISVTETFLPEMPNNLMTIFAIKPGASQLVDWTFFDNPTRVLHVQKDIIALAGLNSAATLSFVDQTFSQVAVPEPVSVMLAGISLLGVTMMSRRKLYRRTRRR